MNVKNKDQETVESCEIKGLESVDGHLVIKSFYIPTIIFMILVVFDILNNKDATSLSALYCCFPLYYFLDV